MNDRCRQTVGVVKDLGRGVYFHRDFLLRLGMKSRYSGSLARVFRAELLFLLLSFFVATDPGEGVDTVIVTVLVTPTAETNVAWTSTVERPTRRNGTSVNEDRLQTKT